MKCCKDCKFYLNGNCNAFGVRKDWKSEPCDKFRLRERKSGRA